MRASLLVPIIVAALCDAVLAKIQRYAGCLTEPI